MQVRKRDGSLEEFDRTKVARSMVAAGVPEAEADRMAAEVEDRPAKVAIGEIVSSLEVRNKVLELLRIHNPEAADGFEAYHKPA